MAEKHFAGITQVSLCPLSVTDALSTSGYGANKKCMLYFGPAMLSISIKLAIQGN